MTRKPYQDNDRQQELITALRTLSARERVGLLLRATRTLTGRDKAVVFRAAGLSLLRDRFLPILLHVLLKHILVGALWWTLCSVAIVLLLLLLLFVEQISPQSVTPVLVAALSFLAGFLLFSLVDFCSDIFQFFKTTRSRSEREALLSRLNACDYAERVAALRAMSVALAGKVPGESLLASFLMLLLLLVLGAVLMGLVVVISSVLPALGSSPLLVLVAIGALLLGFFAPRAVHHRLVARNLA